jgi:hypothetical protein
MVSRTGGLIFEWEMPDFGIVPRNFSMAISDERAGVI